LDLGYTRTTMYGHGSATAETDSGWQVARPRPGDGRAAKRAHRRRGGPPGRPHLGGRTQDDPAAPIAIAQMNLMLSRD